LCPSSVERLWRPRSHLVRLRIRVRVRARARARVMVKDDG
jgi:hypothetical protein